MGFVEGLRKKKSVLLLLVVCFWFGYSTISVLTFVHNIHAFYDTETQRRKSHIEFQLQNATFFLLTENVEPLVLSLKKARGLHEFDFFLLKKGSEVVAFGNADDYLEGINYDYQILDQFQEIDSLALKTIKVDDYKLTLGINKLETTFIVDQLNVEKIAIIKDLLVVTIFAALIFFFILKDILNISKLLKRQNRGELGKIKTLSTEAQVLLNASTGFEEQNQKLSDENALLTTSVSPAIQTELLSGKESPYAFMTTLVRVDLNGYTQLFLERREEYLTQLLNQYFLRAREVIERYGGLIYQYLGDEIIFHIKDEAAPEGNSAKMAMACLRSLFEEVSIIEDSVRESGHSFKVKSSFVHGRLRFVRLDQGHALSGLPLIESVRMLGQISEKNENTLCIYAEEQERCHDLCSFKAERVATFKGFQSETKIVQVEAFKSIQEVLSENITSSDLSYYRSDQDIIKVLEYLKSDVVVQKEAVFFEVYKSYSHMNISLLKPEVVSTFKKLLTCLKSRFLINPQLSKVTCVTLSLCKLLIPATSFDTEFEEIIVDFLQMDHPRVKAVAVSILSHFGRDNVFFDIYLKSDSSRLSAEALLAAGKMNLSSKVVKGLKKLMKSQQNEEWQSGLYTTLSLLRFHHHRDPVFYKSNPKIQDLELAAKAYLDKLSPEQRQRADVIFKPSA